MDSGDRGELLVWFVVFFLFIFFLVGLEILACLSLSYAHNRHLVEGEEVKDSVLLNLHRDTKQMQWVATRIHQREREREMHECVQGSEGVCVAELLALLVFSFFFLPIRWKFKKKLRFSGADTMYVPYMWMTVYRYTQRTRCR